MITVSAQRRGTNYGLMGLSGCAQPNDPPPMTITPMMRGLADGGCTGIVIPPQPLQPALGDIFDDAKAYADKIKNGVTDYTADAAGGLGRALGSSLGQAIETAVEKNPTSAKAIVGTGAALGAAAILSAFGIGYLIGAK
ncbi:MAG: hypothetical protein JNL32_04800 [Candidatus Kapabacteria bacterium]|nr:hypothetical protein [Candidatus Kapabacteria bacterium]